MVRKQMANRNQKIFVLIAAGLVVVGIFYSLNSDTLFGRLLATIEPVDWDEVHERNIEKTSIPIFPIEKIGGECIAKADKFALLADQRDFLHSQELKDRLQYDENEKTIIIPCVDLEEKLRFSLWTVDKDDPIHALKYEYFITSWNQTVTGK